MPSLNIYLNDEEYEFVKGQPKGYVKQLIQKDMGVGPEKVDTLPKKESQEYLDTFKCKECNQIKMAGKCINKLCKLKGK